MFLWLLNRNKKIKQPTTVSWDIPYNQTIIDNYIPIIRLSHYLHGCSFNNGKIIETNNGLQFTYTQELGDIINSFEDKHIVKHLNNEFTSIYFDIENFNGKFSFSIIELVCKKYINVLYKEINIGSFILSVYYNGNSTDVFNKKVFSKLKLPNYVVENACDLDLFSENIRNVSFTLKRHLYSNGEYFNYIYSTVKRYYYRYEYKPFNKKDLKKFEIMVDLFLKYNFVLYENVGTMLNLFQSNDFLSDIYQISEILDKEEYLSLSTTEQKELMINYFTKIIDKHREKSENNLDFLKTYLSY